MADYFKKQIITVLILFAFVAVACAEIEPPSALKVGSIDEECQANGFDFGIVKFEGTGAYYVAYNSSIPPWSVLVVGANSQANWTASPAVDGVLHKEGTSTYVHAGGTSGVVYMNNHSISHITFCGNNETTTTTLPGPIPAPEYPTPYIPILASLLTVSAMFLITKWK